MDTFEGTSTSFELADKIVVSIDNDILKYNSLNYEGDTCIFQSIFNQSDQVNNKIYVGVHCKPSTNNKHAITIVVRETQGMINDDNILNAVKNDPSVLRNT